MNKIKKLLSWTPEVFLITETIFYWLSSSYLNPIAMALLTILIILLIYKNRTLGFITSALFLLLNLYMFLAVASEGHKFPSMTDKEETMLIVTATMIGIGVIASTLMLITWAYRPLLTNNLI
jgi:hypothetical protein